MSLATWAAMLIALWLLIGIATNLRIRRITSDDGSRRLRVCWEDRYVEFYRYHIEKPNGTYMRRYLAQLDNGRSMRLHNIRMSDNDRDPHGHPFAFTSVILWGGYREEIYVAVKASGGTSRRTVWSVPRVAIVDRGMFSVCRVPADRLHKVKLIDNRPAWTLCFTGPRVKPWGFYTRSGFVHHRDYEMRSVA